MNEFRKQSQRLSFYELMELGLYDHECGYYSAGRVQFGDHADFWTFPERMSPIFGQIIANNALEMALALHRVGLWSPGDNAEPFTILELGAGRGILALDILDYAEAQYNGGDPRWTWFFPHLNYQIGERSPALRAVQQTANQRHIQANRLQHVPFPDGAMFPELQPIVGLVLSNELFDVYPHHWLKLPDRTAYITATWPAEAGEDLVTASRSAMGSVFPNPEWILRFKPAGSWDPGSVTTDYLTELSPLWEHHRKNRNAPSLFISPRIADFAAYVRSILRTGFVITIDYGGTVTQICDPEPMVPPLRTYPELADAYPITPDGPKIGWPGAQDITVDIDFTFLAFAGTKQGLDVVFFGPQGDLVYGIPPEHRINPRSRECREQMLPRHRARTGLNEIVAHQEMYHVARSFCDQSPGFRVLVQQTTNVPTGTLSWDAFSDPVLPEHLQWLIHGDQTAWAATLVQNGLPPEAAESLRLLGDPWSDLDHRGFRHERRDVMAALQLAGYLNRER